MALAISSIVKSRQHCLGSPFGALGECQTCQVPLPERRKPGRLRTVREAPTAMRLDACWEWLYGDRISRKRRAFRGRQKGNAGCVPDRLQVDSHPPNRLHVETLSKPAASTKHPLTPLNKVTECLSQRPYLLQELGDSNYAVTSTLHLGQHFS